VWSRSDREPTVYGIFGREITTYTVYIYSSGLPYKYTVGPDNSRLQVEYIY